MITAATSLIGRTARWISGVDVQWLWKPAELRPRIYFANHTSHLDALVLWAALPEPVRTVTRPVAAQDYWQRSWLRRYLAGRLFRSVLVPRAEGTPFSGRRILGSLLLELERGCSLILFPEGTRGSGEEIAEFKSGLYQLCRERGDLEAVPVYLDNLHRVLPKGKVLPSLSKSRVIFGSPLRLRNGEDKSEFLCRARQTLCALRPAHQG